MEQLKQPKTVGNVSLSLSTDIRVREKEQEVWIYRHIQREKHKHIQDSFLLYSSVEEYNKYSYIDYMHLEESASKDVIWFWPSAGFAKKKKTTKRNTLVKWYLLKFFLFSAYVSIKYLQNWYLSEEKKTQTTKYKKQALKQEK